MSHNKEGERVILRQRLESLIAETTDPTVKLEIFKLMSKLLGLLDKDQDEALNIGVLNLYPAIQFTSDAAVLHQPEPEDTPFTEV
jgi:hypothetical protein